MALSKVASKNAKKEVSKGKFINFVKDGDELGRSNYRSGKRDSIRNGRNASKFMASGSTSMAQRAMMEGAKGAGTAKTALKNRGVFGDKRNSNFTISNNEFEAKAKKEGWGKGKSAKYEINRARRKAKNLPDTTVRPLGNKAKETFVKAEASPKSIGTKAGEGVKKALKLFKR